MKLDYTRHALGTLNHLPVPVRKAFYKQAAFLVANLHHPSLRAKKYSEAEDRWQARVNRGWRFYFRTRTSSPRSFRIPNEKRRRGMCRIDLGLRLPSLQEGKLSLKPLNGGLIGNRNIKIGV